jgi:hypothetical protein
MIFSTPSHHEKKKLSHPNLIFFINFVSQALGTTSGWVDERKKLLKQYPNYNVPFKFELDIQ